MKYAALSLALALLPIAASAQMAQTAGSQIDVSECNPHVHTAAEAHPWVDPYGVWHYNPTAFPSFDAFLAISYANQARQPATEIDFGLVLRARSLQ